MKSDQSYFAEYRLQQDLKELQSNTAKGYTIVINPLIKHCNTFLITVFIATQVDIYKGKTYQVLVVIIF